jgi:hypothetical protein
LGPFGTAATDMSIVPTPSDYDDGETGGMMIDKGIRSTRRKRALVPLCPPQNLHACPNANPGRRGGKPATNRLSYGLVGIVTGCGLDVPGSIPGRARVFSSPQPLAQLLGHPASYTMRTVGAFPGVKLTTSAEIKITCIYTSTPPKYLHVMVLNSLNTETTSHFYLNIYKILRLAILSFHRNRSC